MGTGGTVLHYDGSSGSRLSIPNAGQLIDVWGLGPGDVYVVGDSGTVDIAVGETTYAIPINSVFHSKNAGITWTRLVDVHYDWLLAISGISPTHIFTVGGNFSNGANEPAIYAFDGSDWSDEPLFPPWKPLWEVWAVTPTEVFAVGVDGTILRHDGTEWAQEPSGTTKNLLGVWGMCRSDVFAVGEDGTILHRKFPLSSCSAARGSRVAGSPFDWKKYDWRLIYYDQDRPYPVLPNIRRYTPKPWCAKCKPSFSATWQPEKEPADLSELYGRILLLLQASKHDPIPPSLIKEIDSSFRASMPGRYYSEDLKNSFLKSMEKYGDLRAELSDFPVKLIETLNRIELDRRIPPLSPKSVQAGPATSIDFEGVCRLDINGLEKPGKARLSITAGLPATVEGFSPGWPVATYAVDFDGKVAGDGYVEVSFYIGGISFIDQRSSLRLFEWDGKAYRDITTGLDLKKRIISGRTKSLLTYVVMTQKNTRKKSVSKKQMREIPRLRTDRVK